jgi:hypothetical protein
MGKAWQSPVLKVEEISSPRLKAMVRNDGSVFHEFSSYQAPLNCTIDNLGGLEHNNMFFVRYVSIERVTISVC